MEIKSFILKISRQYFLDNVEKFNLDVYDNPPLTFISLCLDRWFFSHDRNVKVTLDDVKLPEVRK